VKSIGNNVFSYCNKLTHIIVDYNNTVYSSESGVLFSKDKTVLIQFPAGKTGSYIIPDSVTSIIDYAFSNCNITSVTIPDSVKSIGYNIFAFCKKLTDIIVDPNNTVYSSEAGVLFNNDKTTLIQFPAGKMGSYIIPHSVTSIGHRAFAGCNSLTSIIIPDSVTSIVDSAFGGCNSLTSVTIPDSVTSIGHRAFAGCNNLTSIIIPDSVTSIGDRTFEGCSSLEYLSIQNKVPPCFHADVLDFIDKDKCTLLVPSGAVSAYRAATGWNSFKNIIDMILIWNRKTTKI
jgi:hypothetical protein